jgi:DNA-binding winged helix-turn-helix (wHTH) protein/Flp pilus assembly protein TadD
VREKKAYVFGPFKIDATERELARDGAVIPLPPKVIDTLLALLANPGRTLTKAELGDLVWPDTVIELDNALARNISQLRKALAEDGDDSQYIRTVSKLGYRFIGSVVERSLEKPEGRTGLAVLPLRMLSNEPGLDSFCEGMNEVLITNLAKITALRIYQADITELAELARAHNVENAVEGAYFLAGGRARITVRLIRAGTREQLWAESYEGDLRDIMDLQALVAQDVARQIRARVTSWEQQRLTRPQPVNPEAYKAYLEGRFWWNQRTVESLYRSIDCFRLALARDPEHARAYSGLADSYALLGSSPYNARPPKELFPKATEFARKALDLDEDLAEARSSLAFVKLAFDWDAAAAEGEFLVALDLNPGYATARHWHGLSLMALGQFDHALVEFTRAQELDSRSPIIASGIGWCHYFAGRCDRAVEQYLKILRHDPNYVLVIASLGFVCAQGGRSVESIAALEQAVKLAPNNPTVLAALGYAYAMSSGEQEAQHVLHQLSTLSRQQYVPAMSFALIHLGRQENDIALNWLEKAYEERSDYINYVSLDPAFAGLRSDRRFATLRLR